MTSKEPRHKGVGLIPVVQAIRGNAAAREQVPAELEHYLTDQLLPSAWYPECDYDLLLQLLARATDRKLVGGDVWAFFGRSGARRDVGGDEGRVPKDLRSSTCGTYRRLLSDVQGMDLAGLFLRGVKLWGLYHDTGCVRAARDPRSEHTVLMGVYDFFFACRGLMEMQTAYFIEFARLCGFAIDGKISRVADGGRTVEWQYSVAHTLDNRRQIAAMPLLHEFDEQHAFG